LQLQSLAERLGCRLEGDGSLEILRVAGIEQAGPGDLTFVANRKYQPLAATTRAAAIILAPGIPARCAVLRTDEPYLTFARALGLLSQPQPPARGVDPLAAIAKEATLGPDVSIGPFVTVGAGASIGARTILYPGVVIGPGAQIGDDCILYSHVSVRERAIVGNRVILHDGAVIGSDGFGFAKQVDGTHFKIPQLAAVVIEDDVELGANTTVDRPPVGETRIRAGTKVDNLVQIAHGVSVGHRVLLAAQVGIAGSTVVDDDVVLAGQVGVAGHLRLGRGVMATAQTGIPGTLPAGAYVSGTPAIPHDEWLKTSAVLRRLPELRKRLAELEHRVAELEEQLAACRTPSDR
jgi:UDP-3-O-[3-hydroxymyristoyl] glucosamine N-acyltransferase